VLKSFQRFVKKQLGHDARGACCICFAAHASADNRQLLCATCNVPVCAGPVMTGWGSRMPAQCVGGRSAFTKVISTVFVARVHCTKLIHLLFHCCAAHCNSC
jgi:hypothetical protein